MDKDGTVCKIQWLWLHLPTVAPAYSYIPWDSIHRYYSVIFPVALHSSLLATALCSFLASSIAFAFVAAVLLTPLLLLLCFQLALPAPPLRVTVSKHPSRIHGGPCMIHASTHPEGNARGTLCAATHSEPAALASAHSDPEPYLTMPSTRRIKVVAALIAVVIFCLYYFSVCPLPLDPDQAPKLSTPFGELQNDPSTLSSSDFYSRTVAAMDREAQKSSHVDPGTPAKHDTMNHKANQVGADGKVNEPPPIPPAKGQEHEAVLVAPDDKSVKPDKPDAKGVPGRKKYMGGENWDVASGKQAPIGAKRKGDEDSEAVEEKAKEGKAETEEEHEIEVELNAILKKGPSESTPPVYLGAVDY